MKLDEEKAQQLLLNGKDWSVSFGVKTEMDGTDSKHEFTCLTVNTVKFGIYQKCKNKMFMS